MSRHTIEKAGPLRRSRRPHRLEVLSAEANVGVEALLPVVEVQEWTPPEMENGVLLADVAKPLDLTERGHQVLEGQAVAAGGVLLRLRKRVTRAAPDDRLDSVRRVAAAAAPDHHDDTMFRGKARLTPTTLLLASPLVVASE
jgi:hypothetical protein